MQVVKIQLTHAVVGNVLHALSKMHLIVRAIMLAARVFCKVNSLLLRLLNLHYFIFNGVVMAFEVGGGQVGLLSVGCGGVAAVQFSGRVDLYFSQVSFGGASIAFAVFVELRVGFLLADHTSVGLGHD